jgi:hypothetical protein
MKGPAQLADFNGVGGLVSELGEGGELVFEGLWRPDDPEHAYDALHRLYMAREAITFRGPVRAANKETASEDTLDVIIVEWSNEEHPAALKLRGPAEEF